MSNDEVTNQVKPGYDPDAHAHPLTEDLKHALDWSSGPDDTTHYVHSHPHEPGHGTLPDPDHRGRPLVM